MRLTKNLKKEKQKTETLVFCFFYIVYKSFHHEKI